MTDDKKNYWRKDFNSDDYVILGGGLISTVLAFALSAFSISKDFSLISWLVWFIAPMGAVFLGGISAAGFFIAARIRQRKMSSLGAILMLLILIPSYFMHYGFVYRNTFFQVEDAQVAHAPKIMNFWEFYRYEMTSRVYVNTRATDEQKAKANPVGKWGYFYAVIEMLGFLVGGFAMLFLCSQWAYCDNCQRYYDEKQIGLTTDKQKAKAILEAMQTNNESSIKNNLALGWPVKVSPGENLKQGGHFYLTLSFCKLCHENSTFAMKFRSATSSNIKDIQAIDISQNLAKELLGIK